MDSNAQRLSTKRTDYLEWSEYFMANAILIAQRSKDPCTQVGACIVNSERKVVGIGYNGFPLGCDDDKFPWDKNCDDPLQVKHMYVCHAEVNAILNKISGCVKGCSIYVTLFPCNECAKMIIQSGIREVIFMSYKHKCITKAAMQMFDAAGITVRKFPFPIAKTITFVLDINAALNELNIGESSSSPCFNNNNNINLKKSTEQGYNNLTWPDYFMATALLAAQRSKDPNTQVGACIVNDENKIVGIGYNGFPTGCNDDEFPWSREIVNNDPLSVKYMFVCHAEMNAILNKNCDSLSKCTIYVTLFPCNECAKIVIQSGIRKIVFLSDKYSQTPAIRASKKMFQASRVECLQFKPLSKQITIDFNKF